MDILDTVLISIVGGGVGGLFGPFLSNRLDRWQRRDLRKEERQRGNHDMLMGYMSLASTNGTALGFAMLGGDLGILREKHESFVKQVWDTYPTLFWRPSRIRDPLLREHAFELQKANGEATGLLMQLFQQRNSRPDTWFDSAYRSKDRVEQAIDAVDSRLTEMDW